MMIPRAVYLLLLFMTLTAARNFVDDDNSRNDDDGQHEDYRRALQVLQGLLDGQQHPHSSKTKDSAGAMRNIPPIPLIRKRTCYFNGGMSHGCDYKELLKSVSDANYWNSEYTPGRRRKRASSSNVQQEKN